MMNEQFHSTIMRLQRINDKSETETVLEVSELKTLGNDTPDHMHTAYPRKRS